MSELLGVWVPTSNEYIALLFILKHVLVKVIIELTNLNVCTKFRNSVESVCVSFIEFRRYWYSL